MGEPDGEGVAACDVGEDRGGGGGRGGTEVQRRMSPPVSERILVVLLRMRESEGWGRSR